MLRVPSDFEKMVADGLHFKVTGDRLDVTGCPETIDRWTDVIRENRAVIRALLAAQASEASQTDETATTGLKTRKSLLVASEADSSIFDRAVLVAGVLPDFGEEQNAFKRWLDAASDSWTLGDGAGYRQAVANLEKLLEAAGADRVAVSLDGRVFKQSEADYTAELSEERLALQGGVIDP
jgi:hypothetical protein